MRSILLAIVLFFAGPAFAEDLVARSGSDVVRLTDKPCTNAAVLKLLQMLPERWRAASATIDGKKFEACWLPLPDSSIAIRYEDGDGGRVPANVFKPGDGSV